MPGKTPARLALEKLIDIKIRIAANEALLLTITSEATEKCVGLEKGNCSPLTAHLKNRLACKLS